jgi:transposase
MEASRSVGVGETVLRRLGAATSDGTPGRHATGQGNHAGSQRIQELEARIERLEREKAILKNVWSAPDLQVTGLRFRQNNVCVNVSGLLLQSADCWP